MGQVVEGSLVADLVAASGAIPGAGCSSSDTAEGSKACNNPVVVRPFQTEPE